MFYRKVVSNERVTELFKSIVIFEKSYKKVAGLWYLCLQNMANSIAGVGDAYTWLSQ